MEATQEELAVLVRLQQADMELNKATRAFEELPQRAVIVAARQKQTDLAKKLQTVMAALEETQHKVTRLAAEDEKLVQKQQDTQAAIDAAGGDYRNLEKRTKELEGFAKRRATLAEDQLAVEAELEKIQGLKSQIDQLMAAAKAKEAKATEEFKAEGTVLRQTMGKLEAAKNQLLDMLPPDKAELYLKTLKKCGGVALGLLSDGKCSVCRTTFNESHLISVRSQAPLAVCPNCKRLLLVQK